jgi:hypothetical protein
MAVAATICTRCGQPVVPTELALPWTKRRILDAVQRHPGINAERLRDLVWQDDPGGGPECRHALYVHVNQLNRQLASAGIAVRAARSGSAGYRIVSVRS